MLANIRPAVDALATYAGDRTSANEAFVHLVAEQNVRVTMDDIRKKSPILRQMEADAEIAIAGGLYDMDTGEVVFLE